MFVCTQVASRHTPMQAHTQQRMKRTKRTDVNKNGSLRHIYNHLAMPWQTNPPIQFALLQIQMSNIDKFIPILYKFLMYQPVHRNLQIPLSTRVCHGYTPIPSTLLASISLVTLNLGATLLYICGFVSL